MVQLYKKLRRGKQQAAVDRLHRSSPTAQYERVQAYFSSPCSIARVSSVRYYESLRIVEL